MRRYQRWLCPAGGAYSDAYQHAPCNQADHDADCARAHTTASANGAATSDGNTLAPDGDGHRYARSPTDACGHATGAAAPSPAPMARHAAQGMAATGAR